MGNPERVREALENVIRDGTADRAAEVRQWMAEHDVVMIQEDDSGGVRFQFTDEFEEKIGANALWLAVTGGGLSKQSLSSLFSSLFPRVEEWIELRKEEAHAMDDVRGGRGVRDGADRRLRSMAEPATASCLHVEEVELRRPDREARANKEG